MGLCGDLLRVWCDKLLELQVTSVNDPALRGGILCPACAGIHGRCFDAIYPFLYLADADGDSRYLEAAKMLFDWAENTVSREDGSYVNDTNSDWKGTTVFSVIQLTEALTFHGHLLDSVTYERWKQRIARAADFLCTFKEFEVCNINYCITNSLALLLCSDLLGEARYASRGSELLRRAVGNISDSGILFGEGRPVSGYSRRGCRPVDIGYNLEESLPALIQYACASGEEEWKEIGKRALKRQLLFLLDDGGIDNSFGTRNYKWTYWGSRTSDGCTLGYLLAADGEPDFAAGAYKNLKLLEACTHDGCLYGGLYTHEMGEYACIHHTFSHAKVLAGILDRGLEELLEKQEQLNKEGAKQDRLPRMRLEKTVYIEETDTYLIPGGEYTATVTGYDWEYVNLKGGHAEGGTLTLLWHERAGLVICGGMSQYTMREANNMQLPRFGRHECVTPRLECTALDGKTVYSSLYDGRCEMIFSETGAGTVIAVKGRLTDINQHILKDGGAYDAEYSFEAGGVRVRINVNQNARFILPLVSESTEKAVWDERGMTIEKRASRVHVNVENGVFHLPYKSQRIYNLVPGVEAIKAEIVPEQGIIAFCISF